MKPLIFFIGFIVLTGAVNAQSWSPSVIGYIQSYPQYQLIEHNTPKAVEMIRTADTTNPEYQNYLKYMTGDEIYSFISKNKFYMLSYDTCSTCYRQPSVEKPITRGLYLFRLDNEKWTKVSESIQTDYYRLVSSVDEPNKPQHNIWSTYCYVPSKKDNGIGVKDGSVIVSEDGEVTIVLVNYRRYLESDHAIKQSNENRTIVLIPDFDGMYKIR